ncbi:TonB-dependent receptor plug domain-containing protein [Croceibacterium xixiisoli]
MMKNCVGMLGVALAMSTPSEAFAQEEEDAAAKPIIMRHSRQIVVTASRAIDYVEQIGSAISVITANDLALNQARFLKDALQDVPGVQISSDRPGDMTSVSIRGSSSDEVLWLIDGIELGDPSNISTAFSPDHLVSHDIARIEVLRGNQSALYGSDAIGGVINITTRRSTGNGVEVSAEAEAGSYGTTSGGVSVLGGAGPMDFRVTATGYEHAGPSLTDPATADVPVTEQDGYSRYGFSGRIGIEASPDLQFQAIGFWQDSFSDLDNTGSDSDDVVRKVEHAVAGQAHYTANGFSAKATASRYQARRLYFGQWNAPQGDAYRGTKDNLLLDLTWRPIWEISLAAGGNLERERTNQTTSFSGNFREGMDTSSAYAEMALSPTDRLTVTGAARIDDNNRFGAFDTYRATVAYVLDAVKLRASYGTGAKAPGLYQLFDPSSGNPDLQAETSQGWDAGADFYVNNWLKFQLTYFNQRKRNEIVWDASRPPFGGYAQFGRTRAQGVEFGLTAEPHEAVRISQMFTYTDHEVANTIGAGYVDSGRPKYTGTTAVTVLPTDNVEVTARARYRDKDTSGFGGVTQAYAVVDLLASFDISARLQLYGRVVNLFDKQYQMSYGTNTQGLSGYGGVRVNF